MDERVSQGQGTQVMIRNARAQLDLNTNISPICIMYTFAFEFSRSKVLNQNRSFHSIIKGAKVEIALEIMRTINFYGKFPQCL